MTAEGAATIAAVAALVRAVYFACYRLEKLRVEGVETTFGDRPVPRYDGGDTATGTYRPVWPAIARLCLDHQLEPAAFVRAQFLGRGLAPPLPNALLGDGALRRYRAAAARGEADIRRSLAVQEAAFVAEAQWRVAAARGRLTLDAAAREALRDTSLGLSGLFRHCYAARAGDAATAALFRDAALQQYVFQRAAYDRSWAGWIPAALRDAAAAFLGDLHERTARR